MTTKGDQANNIAAGFTAQGQGEEKIPEGIMKPKDITHGSSTDVDATNVASGEPVDGSETKIPEGIMMPKENTVPGNPNIPRDRADVAAGELVDASGKKSEEQDAKIPEGIMKPGSMS